MPTFQDLIIAQSSLSSGTLQDLLLNPGQGSGGGDIIFLGAFYSVEYLGEAEKYIEYVAKETPIEYIQEDQIKIEYLGQREEYIEYLEESKIKIEISCP